MNNFQANICLLAVTLCWSCEVVLLSVLPGGVNPFATTCATSLVGAVALCVCFAQRIAAAFRRDGLKLARRILFLSLMNASYNVLIEMGLEYFDVSTGAFTLSMVVVVLPVMLFIMRRGVKARTWVSALMVLVGIVVAAAPVYSTISMAGLATMLASCIIRALFIVKLSDYAREHDPVTLAAGMSSVNAVITFIPWCIMQPATFATLPWSTELIAVYVIYSYFIVAFATVMNVFAQQRATPAQATIIYATEIIFSIVWATCLPDSIVDHVDISIYIVAGCLFILLGNLVEILPFGRWKKDTLAPAVAMADAGMDAVEADGAIAAADDKVDSGMAAATADEAPGPDGAPASDDAIAHEAALARSSTADLVTRILASIKRPAMRKVALFFILLAVYMVISMPFKVLSVIPGFSDIRPVCMLQPVYGIFFGLPGCFAFAVGNLISDILSDSLRWTSIAGLIGNFAFPYLMYLYWTKLRKKPFHLRTPREVLDMVGSILFCSFIETLIICPAVAIVYPEVDIVLFTVSVIANTSVFSIAFAIPFIILIQEELGFAPLSSHR